MVLMLLACNKGGNSKDNVEKIVTQDITLSAQDKVEEKNRALKSEGNNVVVSDSIVNNTGKTVLQSGQPAPIVDWDKKIIKTANVTLELKSYNAYNTSIHQNLKKYGAYVAGEEQTENDARIEKNLTIKVPVEQFEDLMNMVPSEGVKVLEKRISTEDVTGEVVDTKARMDAK
ncbi:MAG: hypothetical protein JWQ96_2340 [Segetibacter sp.]|nr:hypothetical protein [Segetibacter sp.]